MVGPGGAPPPTVLVVCPGLGHVARGFETFARELHTALAAREDLRSVIVLGRGPARGPDERVAPTLNRETPPARLLGRMARRDGYWAEQMLYALCLVPVLIRDRPDVIVVSDWALANALGDLRRNTRASFALLLSNGAPAPPPYHPAITHVQHNTPLTLGWALDGGEAPERHSVMALGVELPPAPRPPAPEDRAALRSRLSLPVDHPIVLSVAALNMWHKRVDHLIRAVVRMRPRPFLALLGQHDDETEAVLRLADALLGPAGYTARTVAPSEVGDYYRAADAFVLASLYESMGRVLVEALAHGLPVVAHDSPVTRFVMGRHGLRGDLSDDDSLARYIEQALRERPSAERALAQHADMRERFAWEALGDRWAELLITVAGRAA